MKRIERVCLNWRSKRLLLRWPKPWMLGLRLYTRWAEPPRLCPHIHPHSLPGPDSRASPFLYYSFLFIEGWGTTSVYRMWWTFNYWTYFTYLFRSYWNKREPLYSSITVCVVICFYIIYSAILRSQAVSLCLHVILHEWLAFYSVLFEYPPKWCT